MQSGKQTDLILLDFSKTFDKVAREKLLLKLHFYGIRGNILNWIKDFLDNRTQSVILNGTNSDNIAVSPGVLQGSVLGPILFLAYINDLPEQVRSRVRLFAEDTAMYLALDKQADSDRVVSHVVFAWIYCTDVRIHCADILVECRKISLCFLIYTQKVIHHFPAHIFSYQTLPG